MHELHDHGHRFHGRPRDLRSADRVERLEVGRVVALSVEGLDVGSVLDVGTGTGIFAEAFAGIGLDVSGIDANPDMLPVAVEHVPGATFREARAEELPFADGSFDLVFMAHVLHEADQPAQALREARRVGRSRVVVLEWPYREEEHGPPLAHRLNRAAIEGLAAEAGYREVESLALAHMDLYRLAVGP
jgi:ubiquinone/menaquinone biosynthesis C-methylase UbiE